MYVSIRDFGAIEVSGFIGKKGDIAEAMKYLRLDAVELEYFSDGSVYSLKGKDKVNLEKGGQKLLEEELSGNDLKISSFLMHNNFADEDMKKQVDWIIRCIKMAEYFKVGSIRIDPVITTDKEVSVSEASEMSARALSEVFDKIQKETKVYLAMENHGIYGNDPRFLRDVLSKVGDERLGLCLDSGNFYWYGFPIDEVYKIFEEFAPLVRHTHIKNIRYPAELRDKKRETGYKYMEYVCPIYEGDIDHSRFIGVLKEAGYTGDICIEDECLGRYSNEEALSIMKKDALYLKGLL